MLKINEIHELIKRIDESSIDEFVYEIEGVSLKLKKNEAPAVNVTGQAQAVPAAYAPAPQAAKPEAVKPLLLRKRRNKTKTCTKLRLRWSERFMLLHRRKPALT